MTQAGSQDLTERFIQFYQGYYRDEIGKLAQRYPNEQRSLHIDYDDLYQFDRDLAEDFRTNPDQLTEYAEEGLRLFELPADIKLGNAHVRVYNLPKIINVSNIRVHDNHIGTLISVEGLVKQATDVSPKITEAAFQCQRCGTMTYIPQVDDDFQEPLECQGCERKGPFHINSDYSEFIDSQHFTLRSGSTKIEHKDRTPQIEVFIEDDIVGVPAGDYVTVTGIARIKQVDEKVFELYLDGMSVKSVDDSLPSFDPPRDKAMDMKQFMTAASSTLASLPETTREPGTKGKLITPLIEALGWNKFDNSEWVFEYTDEKTERRVDYALFAGETESPDILVEAKQIGTRLDNYETQLYDYLRIFSAEYGLLTDGETYRIYRNHPEDGPKMVAQLHLFDIPEAGIMNELRPSAFTSGTLTKSEKKSSR